MNDKEKLLDDKGNLTGSGKQRKGNLFYLDLGKRSCFITQVEESWLWHKRLCHVNFDNLVKISKNRRVRGIPSLRKPNMGLCKNCQIGKMGKTSFKRKNYHSKEVLELVHTELCGTIGIESYSGDKFFIIFFDDYSRMMTVMYLKEQSEAFQKFKWHLERVEKEIGNRLKYLTSDIGGELISNDFNQLCIRKGLRTCISP